MTSIYIVGLKQDYDNTKNYYFTEESIKFCKSIEFKYIYIKHNHMALVVHISETLNKIFSIALFRLS